MILLQLLNEYRKTYIWYRQEIGNGNIHIQLCIDGKNSITEASYQ